MAALSRRSDCVSPTSGLPNSPETPPTTARRACGSLGSLREASLCQGFVLYGYISRLPRLPTFSPSVDCSLRWQPSGHLCRRRGRLAPSMGDMMRSPVQVPAPSAPCCACCKRSACRRAKSIYRPGEDPRVGRALGWGHRAVGLRLAQPT
jgi:hypothetical protein